MIYRVHKPANYTTISNVPVNDLRLSADALGVLLYLLSKPDDWQVYNLEIETRFGIGRKKLDRIMRELKKAKYIEREREHDGQRYNWITHVYEQPKETEQLYQNGTIETGAIVPLGNVPKGNHIPTTESTNMLEDEHLYWIDGPKRTKIAALDTTTPELARAWREWIEAGDCPKWIKSPVGYAIRKLEAAEWPPVKKETEKSWYTAEEFETLIVR